MTEVDELDALYAGLRAVQLREAQPRAPKPRGRPPQLRTGTSTLPPAKPGAVTARARLQGSGGLGQPALWDVESSVDRLHAAKHAGATRGGRGLAPGGGRRRRPADSIFERLSKPKASSRQAEATRNIIDALAAAEGSKVAQAEVLQRKLDVPPPITARWRSSLKATGAGRQAAATGPSAANLHSEAPKQGPSARLDVLRAQWRQLQETGKLPAGPRFDLDTLLAACDEDGDSADSAAHLLHALQGTPPVSASGGALPPRDRGPGGMSLAELAGGDAAPLRILRTAQALYTLDRAERDGFSPRGTHEVALYRAMKRVERFQDDPDAADALRRKVSRMAQEGGMPLHVKSLISRLNTAFTANTATGSDTHAAQHSKWLARATASGRSDSPVRQAMAAARAASKGKRGADFRDGPVEGELVAADQRPRGDSATPPLDGAVPALAPIKLHLDLHLAAAMGPPHHATPGNSHSSSSSSVVPAPPSSAGGGGPSAQTAAATLPHGAEGGPVHRHDPRSRHARLLASSAAPPSSTFLTQAAGSIHEDGEGGGEGGGPTPPHLLGTASAREALSALPPALQPPQLQVFLEGRSKNTKRGGALSPADDSDDGGDARALSLRRASDGAGGGGAFYAGAAPTPAASMSPRASRVRQAATSRAGAWRDRLSSMADEREGAATDALRRQAAEANARCVAMAYTLQHHRHIIRVAVWRGLVTGLGRAAVWRQRFESLQRERTRWRQLNAVVMSIQKCWRRFRRQRHQEMLRFSATLRKETAASILTVTLRQLAAQRAGLLLVMRRFHRTVVWCQQYWRGYRLLAQCRRELLASVWDELVAEIYAAAVLRAVAQWESNTGGKGGTLVRIVQAQADPAWRRKQLAVRRAAKALRRGGEAWAHSPRVAVQAGSTADLAAAGLALRQGQEGGDGGGAQSARGGGPTPHRASRVMRALAQGVAVSLPPPDEVVPDPLDPSRNTRRRSNKVLIQYYTQPDLDLAPTRGPTARAGYAVSRASSHPWAWSAEVEQLPPTAPYRMRSRHVSLLKRTSTGRGARNTPRLPSALTLLPSILRELVLPPVAAAVAGRGVQGGDEGGCLWDPLLFPTLRAALNPLMAQLLPPTAEPLPMSLFKGQGGNGGGRTPLHRTGSARGGWGTADPPLTSPRIQSALRMSKASGAGGAGSHGWGGPTLLTRRSQRRPRPVSDRPAPSDWGFRPGGQAALEGRVRKLQLQLLGQRRGTVSALPPPGTGGVFVPSNRAVTRALKADIQATTETSSNRGEDRALSLGLVPTGGAGASSSPEAHGKAGPNAAARPSGLRGVSDRQLDRALRRELRSQELAEAAAAKAEPDADPEAAAAAAADAAVAASAGDFNVEAAAEAHSKGMFLPPSKATLPMELEVVLASIPLHMRPVPPGPALQAMACDRLVRRLRHAHWRAGLMEWRRAEDAAGGGGPTAGGSRPGTRNKDGKPDLSAARELLSEEAAATRLKARRAQLAALVAHARRAPPVLLMLSTARRVLTHDLESHLVRNHLDVADVPAWAGVSQADLRAAVQEGWDAYADQLVRAHQDHRAMYAPPLPALPPPSKAALAPPPAPPGVAGAGGGGGVLRPPSRGSVSPRQGRHGGATPRSGAARERDVTRETDGGGATPRSVGTGTPRAGAGQSWVGPHAAPDPLAAALGSLQAAMGTNDGPIPGLMGPPTPGVTRPSAAPHPTPLTVDTAPDPAPTTGGAASPSRNGAHPPHVAFAALLHPAQRAALAPPTGREALKALMRPLVVAATRSAMLHWRTALRRLRPVKAKVSDHRTFQFDWFEDELPDARRRR